ncbi:hypothetical protein N8T08_001372 [Aspergillus melleus]|uniref:Uncharacterized protein n=1 Tax=Aspergillus melleus TaxID=138277 RepID=A0ACC3B9Y1_9EURO|nr:hypothetical protein N8T08_001372 [Aspergillus melleus]
MAFGLPAYILDTAVHHQGQHLRQLRFRQSGLSSVPTPVAGNFLGLSSEQIAELATKLPHVESLGLDMRFENSIDRPFGVGKSMLTSFRNKPCDPLDSIAQFPSLRYLELNTPVYLADHSRPKQSWVEASIAEETFRYVDRIKAGTRLESLDILAGPWRQFQQPFKHTANNPKRRMLPFGWMYASWRDTKLPDKVHELYLPGTKECYWNLSADDVYEQTMSAAGLWDSKAKTVYGPAIWRNALTDFFY